MNEQEKDNTVNPSKENIAVEDHAGHKGAILKRIREERGISLEAVHEATKIPLDSLKAIEEGYTVRTLSEFYYRSFVKIYANYLEIDLNTVLDVRKEQLPRYIKKSPELDLSLLEKLDKLLTKQRKRQILYALAAIMGLFLFFKFITFLMTRTPAPKPQPAAQAQVPVQAVEEESLPQTQSTAQATPMTVAVETAVETVQPALPLKDVMLTVRAKKTSWLRVKVDGEVVFQSNLSAGDAETWSADEQIEITGRNISDLEFELNGKLIGSLGRSSRDAKGLIVTSDGLSVTK